MLIQCIKPSKFIKPSHSLFGQLGTSGVSDVLGMLDTVYWVICLCMVYGTSSPLGLALSFRPGSYIKHRSAFSCIEGLWLTSFGGMFLWSKNMGYEDGCGGDLTSLLLSLLKRNLHWLLQDVRNLRAQLYHLFCWISHACTPASTSWKPSLESRTLYFPCWSRPGLLGFPHFALHLRKMTLLLSPCFALQVFLRSPLTIRRKVCSPVWQQSPSFFE